MMTCKGDGIQLLGIRVNKKRERVTVYAQEFDLLSNHGLSKIKVTK